MKFVTSTLLVVGCLVASQPSQADIYESALRNAAKSAGVLPTHLINRPFDRAKSAIGKKLFESTLLSLNGDTSCQTCHLDRFASADGIPNAVGVGGHGEGIARMSSKGAIVPRNTLPLTGRGGIGFTPFFWDGKVESDGDTVVSQFGDNPPSQDPLVVAAHLPFVEFREMIADSGSLSENLETETQESANAVFDALLERVQNDPFLGNELAAAHSLPVEELKFIHVAQSVAQHIRRAFALKETRFHRFLFANGELSEDEIRGGIIFFGRGRCAACHYGPYLSDFKFHAMPFPQAGFGKNGFGIDYGRYNVTHDDRDLYKFRTPPLWNVIRTAPYGHSGSLATLSDAIKFHFDPLGQPGSVPLDPDARNEFYRRLHAWALSPVRPPMLDKKDIGYLERFLGTFSMESDDNLHGDE